MQSKSIKWLRETEVAEITNLSVKTLQRWRLRGIGPMFRKLGGCAVRYSEADILDWISRAPVGGGNIRPAV